MNEQDTDFNTIVVNQLSSLIEANGVSTELKMQSKGHQITILIESIEEVEE